MGAPYLQEEENTMKNFHFYLFLFLIIISKTTTKHKVKLEYQEVDEKEIRRGIKENRI